MPTTNEFGPRGAYGDWEWHEEVATRIGISASHSPEQRFADATQVPGNTTLKLADGLNVFDTGSLAPGVTVETVDYDLLAVDAGMKYKGIFLQTELYWRRLDAGRRSTRTPGLCAGGVLPWPRSSSSTPSPRRSTATRTPASTTAPNTASA
jgi:hypothetical protein